MLSHAYCEHCTESPVCSGVALFPEVISRENKATVYSANNEEGKVRVL